MERDRRRKKKRRIKRRGKGKKIVLLFVFFIILGIAAGYKTGGYAPKILQKTENTILSGKGTTVEFPDLTVSEEEVSDGFYFQQLNVKEKQIYREILQGVRSMEKMILLHAGGKDDAGKVYEYLMYDRPELFWCDGSSQMTVYEKYTEFSPSYTCTAEQKKSRQTEIAAVMQEAIAGAQEKTTEYEKIKYVFEYLVNTVDYDENALDNQNIYSALVGKKSVCAGYSRAAQYLLNQMGIKCIYVIGTATGQGAHAWNIVSCEGKYYQMDVTFGDPIFQENETGETIPNDIVNYEYLCCTDQEIFTDHQQDDFVPYPVCDSDDLNYYRINGLYYESFDKNEILAKMRNEILKEQELFAVRFGDESAYETAKDEILNDLIPQVAQFLADSSGLEEVKYTYAVDDRKRIVMVFWNYRN